MLTSIKPDSVIMSMKRGDFGFLGVVSFEERATAWAQFMSANERQPVKAFLFDYDTVALPASRDNTMRNHCRDIFVESLKPTVVKINERINPFAMNPLTDMMYKVLDELANVPLVVDITCMTRVHLLALVAALYGRRGQNDIIFCYTVPVGYGFGREDQFGWRDVLFIPAVRRWVFKREGQMRGVILAGHDAERLSVALGEMEPASGIMVYCGNPKRPDFLRRAREVNKTTECRLGNLKMPRWDKSPGPLDGWIIKCIDVCDFQALSEVLRSQVNEAKRELSPIIIFPFGPKPDSLAVALFLWNWGVEDAWVAYPVPYGFSTDYSTGSAELQAFQDLPSSD
jgi:hypothetical protein